MADGAKFEEFDSALQEKHSDEINTEIEKLIKKHGPSFSTNLDYHLLFKKFDRIYEQELVRFYDENFTSDSKKMSEIFTKLINLMEDEDEDEDEDEKIIEIIRDIWNALFQGLESANIASEIIYNKIKDVEDYENIIGGIDIVDYDEAIPKDKPFIAGRLNILTKIIGDRVWDSKFARDDISVKGLEKELNIKHLIGLPLLIAIMVLGREIADCEQI
jgi:hypothetical protein